MHKSKMVTAAVKLKALAPWKKSYEKPRQCIKMQRHHFANKSLYNQTYGFSRSHVQMWQLDHNEGWAWKNWCFWIMVLETTLKSPLDSKEIKPVIPKGNQPWILIGTTNAEADAPVLRSPDEKSWLTGKDPVAGDVEGRRKKGWQSRMRWLDGITDSMGMSLSRLWEMVKDREACVLQSVRSQRVRHDLATEQLHILGIYVFIYI